MFISYNYRTAATGAAYPTAQTGYAVAPAATAATYSTQRTGYDQAYQAAATQGTYASMSMNFYISYKNLVNE